MNEPFSPLLAAVAATRAPRARRGRTKPLGQEPVSRPLPDTRVGVPEVVDHGLWRASKPRHYDPIVCDYQPRMACRGMRW
jgi:hypothetical protein